MNVMDELSMIQAAIEGQSAGILGHSKSMNPYQDDQPEHAEWEKHRQRAFNVFIAGFVA